MNQLSKSNLYNIKVVAILSKSFLSDRYIELTNTLIVDFSDGTSQSYDLSEPLPSKIKSVTALDDYLLQLKFDNHQPRIYNMANRLTGVFSFLQDVEEFEKIQLVHDNRAIGWYYQNELIDLWIDSLYFHSYPVED